MNQGEKNCIYECCEWAVRDGFMEGLKAGLKRKIINQSLHDKKMKDIGKKVGEKIIGYKEEKNE